MVIDLDKRTWFESFKYPAGEQQVRFNEDGVKVVCESEKIYVVGRNPDPMFLALFTDALREIHSGYAELVLPYLPYSRADRRFVDGDCFGLKTFGRIIDGLGYDVVKTLDVHSAKAKKCIANLINIDPTPLIQQTLNSIGKKTIVLLPDEGAWERYDIREAGMTGCTKIRDPKTGALSGFHVPAKDMFATDEAILIIDDICDGGGTFIGIVKELKAKGVEIPLYLYTTHGIYSKGFGLLNTYFHHLYCSDSFPDKGPSKLVTQFPALPLMVKE